jgi:hypothetical protein
MCGTPFAESSWSTVTRRRSAPASAKALTWRPCPHVPIRPAASAGTGPSRRAGPLAAPSVIAVQVDDQHRRRR